MNQEKHLNTIDGATLMDRSHRRRRSSPLGEASIAPGYTPGTFRGAAPYPHKGLPQSHKALWEEEEQ